MEPDPPLPAETQAWVNEYQYRTIMRASHEEYLDATRAEIEWMTRIHQVFNQAEEARAKKG